MKLLICTQKVDMNDDLLGFFHGWIAEFARQCEAVTVICLYQGEYDLPENVRVLSLGKEKNNFQFSIFNFQLLKKLFYLINFYKYIWQERRNYDKVFVHMNSIYVLFGGIFWRIWQKKIGLWHAHGHVPLQLRLAEKLADIIFTSTPSGCRLNSKKIRVVGQGISVADFGFRISDLGNKNTEDSEIINHKSEIKLITIGRIAPIKDLETLIKAMDALRNKNINARLDIIGQIGLAEQAEYYRSLRDLVKKLKLENKINFLGSVPNTKIADYLQNSDIFVSASRTGSLDKVFLEAIACGLPVIGCNEALLAVIGRYEKELFYPQGEARVMAEKIAGLIKMAKADYERMLENLRVTVAREHGLKGLIQKIINAINKRN